MKEEYKFLQTYELFLKLIYFKLLQENLNNEIIGFTDKTGEEESVYYTVTDIQRSEKGSSFISEDPIRDGMNWYGYAGCNPMVYTDPTGLAPYINGIYDGPYNPDYNPGVPVEGPKTNPNGMPQNQSPNIMRQGGNYQDFWNSFSNGFTNTLNLLVNLDFGTDFGSKAWDSFSSGHILQGVLYEIYGTIEAGVDLGVAYFGAGTLGAGFDSVGTLFTTGSTTAAAVSFEYSLNNNFGIVKSSLKNGWNIFTSNIKNFGQQISQNFSNIKSGIGLTTKALTPYKEWPNDGGFLGGYSKNETANPGMIFSRIGELNGSYVAPKGTSLSQRGLPSSYANQAETLWKVEKTFNYEGGGLPPLGKMQPVVEYNTNCLIQ